MLLLAIGQSAKESQPQKVHRSNAMAILLCNYDGRFVPSLSVIDFSSPHHLCFDIPHALYLPFYFVFPFFLSFQPIVIIHFPSCCSSSSCQKKNRREKRKNKTKYKSCCLLFFFPRLSAYISNTVILVVGGYILFFIHYIQLTNLGSCS